MGVLRPRGDRAGRKSVTDSPTFQEVATDVPQLGLVSTTPFRASFHGEDGPIEPDRTVQRIFKPIATSATCLNPGKGP